MEQVRVQALVFSSSQSQQVQISCRGPASLQNCRSMKVKRSRIVSYEVKNSVVPPPCWPIYDLWSMCMWHRSDMTDEFVSCILFHHAKGSFKGLQCFYIKYFLSNVIKLHRSGQQIQQNIFSVVSSWKSQSSQVIITQPPRFVVPDWWLKN